MLIGLSGNSCQIHLTDIVKVSVWDFLLCCQLFHLIEQDVHLELGAEILQTSVAKGLSVAMGNKWWVHLELSWFKREKDFVVVIFSLLHDWVVFRTYTGPLIMRAIMTFISAMYSWRSGYGRSSSVLLLAQPNQETLCQSSDKHHATWNTRAQSDLKMHISLFHSIPWRVHMHDAIHHLAAITNVRGHAGRVLVLIGVRFRHGCVELGIWEET